MCSCARRLRRPRWWRSTTRSTSRSTPSVLISYVICTAQTQPVTKRERCSGHCYKCAIINHKNASHIQKFRFQVVLLNNTLRQEGSLISYHFSLGSLSFPTTTEPVSALLHPWIDFLARKSSDASAYFGAGGISEFGAYPLFSSRQGDDDGCFVSTFSSDAYSVGRTPRVMEALPTS